MSDMTLRQWLGGWLLLLAAGWAWSFAFAGPDGSAWVYAARYAVGFAGLPLLVGAVLVFAGQWGTPVVRRR